MKRKQSMDSSYARRNMRSRAVVIPAAAPGGGAARLQIYRNPQLRTAGVPAALRGHKQEVKSVDFPVAASSPQANIISTTATFVGVNLIQEGASFYNRIGRKIMMRSLHLTGQIVQSGNAPGPNSEYLRIMVIYDRQPNGAFPVIADVLTNYDNAGGTVSNSLCGINMNNAERFKVIRDIRVHIPSDAAAAFTTQNAVVVDYTTNRVNINEFIRLGDLEAHYKSTTNPGAIGDLTTGALFVMTFGNVAAASAAYQIFWTARLRFHDT